jgi:hypothetical protein
MRHVQDAVDVTWVLSLGELRGYVLDAIVLDVRKEEAVPHEDAVDVQQKGFYSHLLFSVGGF